MVEATDLQWAQAITAGANLGDIRRNKRAAGVLAAMLENPGASLYAAARGNSAALEQYYRHARAIEVPADELIKAGCAATAAQIRADPQQNDIVLIGDTTSLSYRHAAAAQLGPMGHVKQSVNRGWLVHTVLAIDATTGETLGPVEQLWWQRDENEHGKSYVRKKRDYHSRESFKWEFSATGAAQCLGSAAHRAIFVSDRESDVFEYLADSVALDRRFVVRGCWDRCIAGDVSHIYEACDAQPALAKARLCIPQKGGRKGREAIVELRATPVVMLPPKDVQMHQPPIMLNVVYLKEVNVPHGCAAVSWLLLTTESIDTTANVLAVVTLYSRRWRIEEFHKFWKSEGTQVEKLRMATPDNLRRVAALMVFAACRLMCLRDAVVAPTVHLALVCEAVTKTPDPPLDSLANTPCSEVLTETQWAVLWALTSKDALPPQTPSRRWASLAVAKLGNWVDTKRTGRPGYKAYVLGWSRLMDACEVLEIASRAGLIPSPLTGTS